MSSEMFQAVTISAPTPRLNRLQDTKAKSAKTTRSRPEPDVGPDVCYRSTMDDASTTLWQFVRGDLAIANFEAWLYRQPSLEQELGSALYMELISFDYRDSRDLFVLRGRIDARLRPALKCECVTLADMAAVPMGCDGLDQRVFATVRRVCDYGSTRWWLSLNHCSACGQDWMVAQEERIYDNYFMRRLDEVEARKIVDANQWPDDFSTYERVLRVGRNLTEPYRFLNGLAGSLVWTVQDLRKERPDISVQEIAHLLGVSSEHAERLLLEA